MTEEIPNEYPVVIHAPLEQVYEYIKDPKNYSTPNMYARSVSNVRADREGNVFFDLKEHVSFALRTNSRIKTYTVAKRRRFAQVNFEIYPKFNIGTSSMYIAYREGVTVMIYFTLEDIGHGRTLAIKYTIVRAPKLLVKFVERKADRAETLYVRNLKRIMESS
jgi:hypothetical protein